MKSKEYRELLLSETREELQKADAKASILLAASGIAFAALLTSGGASGWYPDRLSDGTARAFVWIAIGVALVGVAFVGAAVMPRLRAKSRHGEKLHYFGDVEAYWPKRWRIRSRADAYETARRDFATDLQSASTEEKYLEYLDDQIWHLGRMAYRKYRLISIGMYLYGIALVCAIVALIVEKT